MEFVPSPRHLFWELNSSQPRRPICPCWHSSIALTGVKGGHCRLGLLTAVWPGHSPQWDRYQGWAPPAQGPSRPGQAKDIQGCVSTAPRGRGGGAPTPVGRGGGGGVLPPGGAPRLGCSDGVAGRLRREGPGPGFRSWTTTCPTQHPDPKSTPNTQVRTGPAGVGKGAGRCAGGRD